MLFNGGRTRRPGAPRGGAADELDHGTSRIPIVILGPLLDKKLFKSLSANVWKRR